MWSRLSSLEQPDRCGNTSSASAKAMIRGANLALIECRGMTSIVAVVNYSPTGTITIVIGCFFGQLRSRKYSTIAPTFNSSFLELVTAC